ncbi:MAG: hypothetical protein KME45_33050 [Stenomitos rutilans HA7619-LM2]|jgi:uncharacterized coiled-coil DUF342 family protein|nr:hypothetical protein [Stenomitos rutilans HA7619-LM2]
MAELADFGQNLEEATQKLNQLLSLIDLACNQLDETSSEITSENEALTQGVATFETSAEGLKQALSGAEGELGGVETEVVAKLDALQQSLTESQTKVDEAFRELDGSQNTFETEVATARTEFNEEIVEVKQLFVEVKITLDELQQALTSSKDTTKSSFNEFVEIANDTQKNTTEFQIQVNDEFKDFVDELNGNLTTTVGDAFNDFSNELAQEQKVALIGGFENLDGGLSATYDSFNSQIEQLGEHLKDCSSEIIQHCASDCENTVKQKLEDAFERAIQEYLEAIAMEVFENVTVVSLGTEITAAMTAPIPILVALAAVKVQLEMANTVLGLLG